MPSQLDGFNFSDDAAKAVELANDEASRLKHQYVGTEHLLPGLLRVRKCAASQLLYNHGVKLRNTRRTIKRIVGTGPNESRSQNLTWTPRALNSLAHARVISRIHNKSGIEPEHLLIGLLHDRNAVCVQIILSLVTSGTVVDEIADTILDRPGTTAGQ